MTETTADRQVRILEVLSEEANRLHLQLARAMRDADHFRGRALLAESILERISRTPEGRAEIREATSRPRNIFARLKNSVFGW